MSINAPLSAPQRLADVLKRIRQGSTVGWILIPMSDERITLGTICYLQTFDAGDVSHEEMTDFEASLVERGLQYFLLGATLDEIQDNLSQQRRDFTEQQLEDAIHYYWMNDAFIDLSDSNG